MDNPHAVACACVMGVLDGCHTCQLKLSQLSACQPMRCAMWISNDRFASPAAMHGVQVKTGLLARPLPLAHGMQPQCISSWRSQAICSGLKSSRQPRSVGSSMATSLKTSTTSTPVSLGSLSKASSTGVCGQRRQHGDRWQDEGRFVHTSGRCKAWSGVAPLEEAQGPVPKYQKIVGVAAGALLLCNLHRSTFSVLLPELGQHIGLSPSQAGLINASMLATYLVGQIPAGHLADVYGGMRVLLWGLAVWSVGFAATAYAPSSGNPLMVLLLSRACVGLASAGIMPCIAAMSTKFVPVKQRGRTIALVWSLFNLGGVIGLALTPLVCTAVGVTQAFQAAGVLGVIWAAVGGLYLAYLEPEPLPAPAAAELTRSTGFTTKSKSTSSLGAFGFGGLGSRGSGLASTSGPTAGGLTSTGSSSSNYKLGSPWNSKAKENTSASGRGDAWMNVSSQSSSSSSPINTTGVQKSRFGNSLQLPSPFSEWGLPKPPWEWFQQQQQGDKQLEAQSWQEQQLGNQQQRVQQQQVQQQQAQQQQAQMLPLLQQQQQLLQKQQEVLRQEMLLQQQQGKAVKAGGMHISPGGWREIGVLCMAHGVIGAGFFIVQAWAPTYIASLGQRNLEVTGFLSSLPWLAAAAVGMVAGAAADRLISSKPWQSRQQAQPAFTRPSITTAAADAASMLSQRLFVRRLMQSISFLGCAASALPLALNPTPSLSLAIGCLTMNCASYAVSYGGFHAHLQDVAGPYAGKVQGASNTCSTAAGVAGTLATGVVLERTGSYAAVFGVLAVLYVAATVLWNALITGQPIFEADRQATQ